MTTTDIKRKIAELLGRSFQAFGSYKTKDGAEFKVEEKMEVGTPIYVITPEGELPVMDGEYELESGMLLKVKEGIVDAIENAAVEGGVAIDETSDQETPEEFDEATLVDGTKIGTDGPFEVGKKLYVKDEANEWVLAPVGEHSTESGEVIVVDGEGFITGLRKPDGEGEGSLEEMMSIFTEAFNSLTKEITSLKSEQKDLKEKFNKIAGSPAGERIFSSYSKTENVDEEGKSARLQAFLEFQKTKRK